MALLLGGLCFLGHRPEYMPKAPRPRVSAPILTFASRPGGTPANVRIKGPLASILVVELWMTFALRTRGSCWRMSNPLHSPAVRLKSRESPPCEGGPNASQAD